MSNSGYYKETNNQPYQQPQQQQYQQPQQQQEKSRGRGSGVGSNFVKRLWDSIIFGMGATIGNRIIGAICS
ncbi:hypothetical protein C6P40_005179 [Pichia californica]|uniref:Uncharacterized protein n=1 Tax=Pichia californica TaxID=460514 RepID=A0A9P7BEI4_9ASCO|nr:hypothetical protein C6P42_005447 [[Candida] californica]KAG0689357.1 hypothetical protein C6P40_005179 [[Candida] californica]